MDWTDWHQLYDAGLGLAARLRAVREQIRSALDVCAPGPVRITSICAGDGRDVIGAVAQHPRRHDVLATCLDSDLSSTERGMRLAAAAGLGEYVLFKCVDAALSDSYLDVAPGDLVIISGMLGHVSDASLPRLLESLPALCQTGGSVIWNRHLSLNRGREHVTSIRQKLRELGFHEVFLDTTSTRGFAVGRVRHEGAVAPLTPGKVLFEFVGIDKLMSSGWDPPRLPDESATPVAAVPSGAPLTIEEVEAHATTLVSEFALQARTHPRRVALGAGDWQPVYEELEAASAALATALLRFGDRGDRVALLMEHDSPMVASMLAVLMAARAVVVLNPTEPAARLSQILANAEPVVILTDEVSSDLAQHLAQGHCEVIHAATHLARSGAPVALPEIQPDDLAFIIYTSGTSGQPKGVMQTHRNICHNVARLSRPMGLNTGDRIALLASPSGGLGLSTTWCALLNGAALCPFPAVKVGATRLASWIQEHRITVLVSSASFFRHFLRTLDGPTQFPSVRMVRLASEQATSRDLSQFRSHFPGDSVLFHTLSSSEAGNISQISFASTDSLPDGPLPVGRAAPGIELLLVDSLGANVSWGDVGEIHVRSRYLSPGYWRDDTLTALKLSAPASPGGARVFRTGDYGRINEDGLLEFMGREDARAKIHGYRVALSEVEQALLREPSVGGAVVLGCGSAGERQTLAAFVLVRPGHTAATTAGLRKHLRALLPAHMIPGTITALDRFPFTPHGKIDRETLRIMVPKTPIAGGDDAPETDSERLMAQAWAEAFDLPSVGRNDDFFELGGDSLVATVVAAKIDSAVHVQLDLRLFSEHPVLASLAAVVQELRLVGSAMPVAPLVRVARDGPLPLSSSQERIWRFSQTPEASKAYTVARRIRITGPLDLPVLRTCLDMLSRRHEILRTTFAEVDGQPVQIINPPSPAALAYFDLAGPDDAASEAMRLCREEIARPFDLACIPLLRFTLLRLKPGEHWLLRVNHHIISDGPSWQIYFKELIAIYDALTRGGQTPLPEFETLQYCDYAAWERDHLSRGCATYDDLLVWWIKQLENAPPPLNLAFRRSTPRDDIPPAEGLYAAVVDSAVVAALDALGSSERATSYTVRLAALVVLLADESSQPDVIVGAYMSNRNNIATQRMFGFFSNLATLRFQYDPHKSFRSWLADVRQTLGEAQAHNTIPYEQLCEEFRRRNLVPPEIRVLFNIIDQAEPIRGESVEFTPLERQHVEQMPWGVTVGFGTQGQTHRCLVAFDAALHDAAAMRTMVARYLRLLALVSSEPDQPLGSLLARSSAPIDGAVAHP